MRVFVAGQHGMLGHVVARYLAQQGCEVVTSEQRYQGLPRDPLVEEIRASNCEWVVNALGRIRQKYHQPEALFQANTLFPLQLAKRLRANQRVVHASTDCVFSGRAGAYTLESEPDAEDSYGWSKVLAECVAQPGRFYLLRTSLVGPELETHWGLMAWFLSQTSPVNGFVNHRWNGITTLEWSRVCLEIIRQQAPGSGPIWHVGFWPPVSKCDLLQMIGQAWNHRVAVRPVQATETLDHSLRPTWPRKSLPEQLAELRQWHGEAFGP